MTICIEINEITNGFTVEIGRALTLGYPGGRAAIYVRSLEEAADLIRKKLTEPPAEDDGSELPSPDNEFMRSEPVIGTGPFGQRGYVSEESAIGVLRDQAKRPEGYSVEVEPGKWGEGRVTHFGTTPVAEDDGA